MAPATQWAWLWVNSGSWWWTGRPGVLKSMGLQRVGHDWATELNWTYIKRIGTSLTTLHFQCTGHPGLIPGQGPSILHAVWHSPGTNFFKKTKSTSTSHIIYGLIQAATLLSNHCSTYISLRCFLQAILAYPHHQCKCLIVRSCLPLPPLPCSLPVRCNLWQFRPYDHDSKGEERQRAKRLEDELVRKRRPVCSQGPQCLYLLCKPFFGKHDAFCDLHTHSFSYQLFLNHSFSYNYYRFLKNNSLLHITELTTPLVTLSSFPHIPPLTHRIDTSGHLSWSKQSGKGTAVLLSATSQLLSEDGTTWAAQGSLSPSLALSLFGSAGLQKAFRPLCFTFSAQEALDQPGSP